MSKKALVIIVVILLAIAGGMVYLLTGDPAKVARDDMTSRQTSGDADPVNEPTSTSPGAYINYSATAIEESKGTKLLFFHAPWCPQCRDLEADIKSQGVPNGVTIIKVDYDSNQSLRQKYGVTIQTTVVRIDDTGNLVEKFVAYDDPSLGAVTQELL